MTTGQDLEDIAQFINRRSRLFFQGHRMSILRARIEQRLSSLAMKGVGEYFQYLRHSPREEALLMDLLTTNETFFFRNLKQFSYLTDKIIPRIEGERCGSVLRTFPSPMKLRILCAGCSTGEEPYSVGMALLESLRYPKAWDIRILACDLSGSCIATAVTGYYGEERLFGIPAAYCDKYLVRNPTGAYIAETVKKMVKFRIFNLKDVMTPPGVGGLQETLGLFDIIFCRNVMIYFSRESQQHLLDALYRHLVPGGYLFTGDAEPLHLYRHEFVRVHGADCLIYRKKEASSTDKTICGDAMKRHAGLGLIDG